MNTSHIIYLVVSALLTLFAGSISYALHKFLTSKSKNENVTLFKKWADEAVNQVETLFADQTSEQKKAEAVKLLTDMLRSNSLLGKFSEDQISGIIELAVREMNALIKQEIK